MEWLAHLSVLKRKLWGPGAVTGLFVIVLLVIQRDQKVAYYILKGWFMLLPALMAMLTPSLLLDDPALELVLTMPRRPIRWTVQRIAVLFGFTLLAALGMWSLGSLLAIPLSGWLTLVPSLALSSLALVLGLLTSEAMVGAAVVGLLWFVQVLINSWWVDHPVRRYLSLFTGFSLEPGPIFWAHQGAMAAICIAGLALSAILMKREERYL